MSALIDFRLTLCALLLGLLCYEANAQDALAIGRDNDGLFNLMDHIEILEDPSNTYELTEVIFKTEFAPLSEYDKEFNRESAYWGKMNIINFDSTKLTWLLFFHRNDRVRIYDFRQRLGILGNQTGYMVPSSEKMMTKGSYYAPIQLPYGVEKNIYFKITQEIHEHNFELFQLKSPFRMLEEYTDRYIFNMLFQGFLWIMVLYNLLVFLYFRDRAGLGYSLYLMSIAIFYLMVEGTIRELILTEKPLLSSYFINVLYLAPLGYYMFLKEFLETPKTVPFWDKVLRNLAIGNLILFFVSISVYTATFDMRLIMDMLRIVVFIDIVALFLATIAITFSKHKMVNYLVLGSVVMALGAMVDIFIWDSGETWGNFARVGFTAEILFFSLGLGKRMRLIEAEKREAQGQLLDEYKKRTELETQQKEELEKEVVARTRELKVQNDQLEKAKGEAEQAAKTKSEFLSVMSHEIRTPMNAIIGTTHLLLEENQNKGQLENLNSLKYAADSLVQLINDILDLNKIESGKIQLENAEFDFPHLIHNINVLFQSKAQEKTIDFQVNIANGIDRYLQGDPGRLSQVLNNLISNAIKFTNEGEVVLRIFTESENEKSIELCFEVSDTGVGIPQDKLEAIFETFTQATSSTTRKFGGTGLGLTISKRLLELQDSNIRVESELGKGSKFSFCLNFEKIKDQDAARRSKEEIEYLPLEDLHVLVVDDNVMNRVVLEQFLQKWQVAYHSVEGGKEALEIIEQQTFNLILLDIQMPEMDGYEVTRTIREKRDSNQDIPIVALSADIYSNVHDKIIASGMDDFVSKPFKPDELYFILQKYQALMEEKARA
ncbi:MAG: response regulator [Cytophagales bacterium]|nr:response regulator [Cytophagales bacterium]